MYRRMVEEKKEDNSRFERKKFGCLQAKETLA
jgi:hypothetical protein